MQTKSFILILLITIFLHTICNAQEASITAEEPKTMARFNVLMSAALLYGWFNMDGEIRVTQHFSAGLSRSYWLIGGGDYQSVRDFIGARFTYNFSDNPFYNGFYTSLLARSYEYQRRGQYSSDRGPYKYGMQYQAILGHYFSFGQGFNLRIGAAYVYESPPIHDDGIYSYQQPEIMLGLVF